MGGNAWAEFHLELARFLLYIRKIYHVKRKQYRLGKIVSKRHFNIIHLRMMRTNDENTQTDTHSK